MAAPRITASSSLTTKCVNSGASDRSENWSRNVASIVEPMIVLRRWSEIAALAESHEVDAHDVGGEIDFAEEREEAADQRDHRANEQRAGNPFEVRRKKLLDEERHDDETHEERRAGAEVNGPARKMRRRS